MGYSPAITPALATKRFEINWIVNKHADIMWFIGGALLGYAMFFLHAGLHLDMLTVWFLWIMFIDTPHFFGTYSRTYFDRQEWQHRKRLYVGSLAWFLVGPGVILFSYIFYKAGINNYRLPYITFIVLFNLWAYWHVVRQHYGIMALYKRKNGDFSRLDLRIDQAVLYVGLIAPFIAFVVRHPQARSILGLNQPLAPYPANFGSGSLFTASFWMQLRWEHLVTLFSMVAVALVTLIFLVRQYQLWRAGKALNLPKLLFLTALIPLYLYICYHPAVFSAPLITFSAFVTIYHDVQYLAIVWFYNKNRYHKAGVDASRYGLAAKISRNFFTFMGCAIVMGAIFRLMGCSLEIHPGCGVLVLTSKQVLFGSLSTKDLLAGLLLGFSMHHYFVDQFIWRPSKDSGLRDDLKIKAAT